MTDNTQQKRASGQPNVVVIICDDIGYGDLGCYGSTMIKTPRLDRIAESGVRLTAMYSGGPTCSPARAALVTGRLPQRCGVGRVLFPTEDRGLHHGEKTIASYLSQRGYATGCFGKWHLGNMPNRGPRRFGFDAYFGLPFSNDTPPIALYRDEEVIEDPADIPSLSRRYTEEAVKFIEALPPEKPFFVYVPYTMPHYPVAPEPAFEGTSEAGPYGDVCEAIDFYCGKLHDCLVRRGVADDTIFIFTSDHGPWFEGSTGGARGRKFETWDGGVRVPFICSWPARIPRGRLISAPVSTMDVLPTLCAVLGLSEDPERPFDGQDITAILAGEDASPHGPIWYFDGYSLNAVREGRWKLHRKRQTWGAERFAQMSLPQLFDMERDPNESYDLSARHPEVVERLLKLMEQLEARVDLQSEDDQRQWWKAGDVKLLEADALALDAALKDKAE